MRLARLSTATAHWDRPCNVAGSLRLCAKAPAGSRVSHNDQLYGNEIRKAISGDDVEAPRRLIRPVMRSFDSG